MSYTKNELKLPSVDNKNLLNIEVYVPAEREPVGIIQISHGMIDYIGRYGNLIEALTAEGYIVAGNDHLGHGKTAKEPEDLGYFADRDGWKLVVRDLFVTNGYLHAEYPDLPIVLLGHSMGSFMARLYAVSYPASISGLIIHGSGGPNPLLAPGKLLAKLIRAAKGARYRSPLITGLAFGSYNKRFDPAEGGSAWLTREGAQVADRDTNPLTNYLFTVSGYIDLFEVLGRSNKAAWFDSFPKELPTLVISGDADPVGDYGKGVHYIHDRLKKRGAAVSLKMYEGARHELFNETNRAEVFADISAWLGEILGR